MHVGADGALRQTGGAREALEDVLGIQVDRQLDVGEGRRQLVEADDSGVRHGSSALPVDAPVRALVELGR